MKYLVTGVAGFIGSHIAESLVESGAEVVGIDNYSNGLKSNIEFLEKISKKNNNFKFIEMDIRNVNDCIDITKGVDIVFHQAALGSVPRSFKFPIEYHEVNATGFINMLHACMEHKVKKFIFASSSSVYGNDPHLPKRENLTGEPLSPYALSKKHNEQYALLYKNHCEMQITGIRYFNVFGPRQKPDSVYAAVIPKWIHALQNEIPIDIFGDGETSRDFCYVKNVVKANMLAAQTDLKNSDPCIFNIACGQSTTLTELFNKIQTEVVKHKNIKIQKPNYKEFRNGDIRHSLADISLAQSALNYKPLYLIDEGLQETVAWFMK